MINKKGQVITGLVSGTGALVITVVVILVIISTLLGANLLGSVFTSTSVTEEIGWNNDSEYQLGTTANATRYDFVINGAANITVAIDSGNWTLNAVTGIVTNSTAITAVNDYGNITYNYTYTITTDTTSQNTADALSENLSIGIDNVSSKIPTVLLIAAVVLLFGVIVLLVRQTKEVGIGGTSNL